MPPLLAATLPATPCCPLWIGWARFISAVTANRNMGVPMSVCSYSDRARTKPEGFMDPVGPMCSCDAGCGPCTDSLGRTHRVLLTLSRGWANAGEGEVGGKLASPTPTTWALLCLSGAGAVKCGSLDGSQVRGDMKSRFKGQLGP